MAGYSSVVNYGNGGPGAAYNTSTTLTDVSPASQYTTAPNSLYVGTVLSLHAFGSFSNTATPTLLLGFYYGGVAGIALAATSAITTTTGATNWPFEIRWKGIVRSTGTSGTIMGKGEVWIPTSLTAGAWRPIPETALATVAIDTTAAKTLTLGAQWGTSSASNTLTVQGFIVKNETIVP
jgi:hypothetical protein